MKKYKDISNQKFGNLVAIRRMNRIGTNTLWLFKCDCGKEVIKNRIRYNWSIDRIVNTPFKIA